MEFVLQIHSPAGFCSSHMQSWRWDFITQPVCFAYLVVYLGCSSGLMQGTKGVPWMQGVPRDGRARAEFDPQHHWSCWEAETSFWSMILCKDFFVLTAAVCIVNGFPRLQECLRLVRRFGPYIWCGPDEGTPAAASFGCGYWSHYINGYSNLFCIQIVFFIGFNDIQVFLNVSLNLFKMQLL